MRDDYSGQKLCIFISKNDTYEGIVLYELLLEIAFNSRLSGGTVTIGDRGFLGAHDESTKLKILRSSENAPVVLEFQGRPNRIKRYIQRIQPMIKEGLMTTTDVQITKIYSVEEADPAIIEEENEHQSKMFEQEVEEVAETEPPSTNEEFQMDDGSIGPDSSQPHNPPSYSEDQAHSQEKIPEFDESMMPEKEAEEEEQVLQLADLSETLPEDDETAGFESGDSNEAAEPELEEPEVAETVFPEGEGEEFEELFEESNEKYEENFEALLKEAGGSKTSDSNTDTPKTESLDKDKVDLPKDDTGNSDTDDSKRDDKHHTKDDVINYFSSLFKSD